MYIKCTSIAIQIAKSINFTPGCSPRKDPGVEGEPTGSARFEKFSGHAGNFSYPIRSSTKGWVALEVKTSVGLEHFNIIRHTRDKASHGIAIEKAKRKALQLGEHLHAHVDTSSTAENVRHSTPFARASHTFHHKYKRVSRFEGTGIVTGTTAAMGRRCCCL